MAKKRIHFLGDSITFFAGIYGGYRERTWMARPDFAHVGTTRDVPWSLFQSNSVGTAQWHNGVNGATIATLTSNYPTWYSLLDPGGQLVTVIHIGVNDVNAGATSAAMLTALGTLLNLIHSTDATTKILLMQMANELFGMPGSGTVVSAYNAGMPALVSARSSYCAMGTMPTDLIASEFYDGDGIHPNGRGMARLSAAVVAGLLAAGY